MSLRGRLVIVLVALMAFGLVVADAATYVALQHFLVGQVDQHLQDSAETVEHGDTDQRGGRGLREQSCLTTPGVFVQTRDVRGAKINRCPSNSQNGTTYDPVLPDPLPPAASGIYDTGGDPGGPSGVGASPSGTNNTGLVTVHSTPDGGPDYEIFIKPNHVDGGVIIVGLPLDELQHTLNRLFAIEVIVAASVIAFSAGLALWLVRVGLHPLDDISATAAEIAAGDLTRRVDREDDKTEVGRLGGSLNEMLGQIETAFEERQRSEDALRRSEERLRRFAADASHELRTPLAAVAAYAELFDRGADQHPEDLPRLMHNIQKETARMAVLVDDLLLLTRLDQRRPLEQSPVDLGALAADAVEAARVVDPDRPVALSVDGLVEVLGDRVRLRQIVDNLLANVRVHTPEGTPVEVEVTTVAAEPDRPPGSPEQFGVVRIVDHGPGLSEDEGSRVFERFYRADPSRSRGDGGSGLGLSIVQAIADAHGGAARVVPTPGGGATFEVAIPVLVG